MSIENGGPAFPCRDLIERDENGHYKGEPIGAQGLTMRDYFAAKAMQGMLAYPGCEMRGSHHNNNTAEGVAAMAYDYADAMLAMRNAPK